MKRLLYADDTSSNKLKAVEYDATFEILISLKVSTGKVISDNSWKIKFRSAVDVMRLYGSCACSDYIIDAVIAIGITIKTINEPTNIARAFWIVNTKDDNNKGGRKSLFLTRQINKNWHDSGLPNKQNNEESFAAPWD